MVSSVRLGIAAVILAFVACSVEAQTRDSTRTWQIEFEFHINIGSAVGAGIGTLPLPGATFTTAQGNATTRQVPSWFFGDGAVLLNGVLAALGHPAQVAVAPIDGLLTSPPLEPRTTIGGGLRLSRNLTPAVALEFGIDVAPLALQISESVRTALAAAVAGYSSAFEALLSDPSLVSGLEVLAQSTTSGGSTTTITATLGARVALMPRARVRPFAVGGGGVAFHVGEDAQATLIGRYQFVRTSNGRPFDETDHVTIHIGAPSAQGVGYIGGGVEFDLGPGRGLIMDARVLVARGGPKTTVRTAPTRLEVVGGSVVSLPVDPTIQFSDVGFIASSLTTPLDIETHRATRTSGLMIAIRYCLRY